jgi:hypothetical protein
MDGQENKIKKQADELLSKEETVNIKKNNYWTDIALIVLGVAFGIAAVTALAMTVLPVIAAAQIFGIVFGAILVGSIASVVYSGAKKLMEKYSIGYKKLSELQKMLDKVHNQDQWKGRPEVSDTRQETTVWMPSAELYTPPNPTLESSFPGPKICQPDGSGNTVLMLAAHHGDMKAVQRIRFGMLYRSNQPGADESYSTGTERTLDTFIDFCNIKNNEDKTALCYAAESDNLDMFKLLIESGASLEEGQSLEAFKDMVYRLDSNVDWDEFISSIKKTYHDEDVKFNVADETTEALSNIIKGTEHKAVLSFAQKGSLVRPDGADQAAQRGAQNSGQGADQATQGGQNPEKGAEQPGQGGRPRPRGSSVIQTDKVGSENKSGPAGKGL